MKKMLNLMITFLCVAALGFTSCSKDDDDDSGKGGGIVGKWKLIEDSRDGVHWNKVDEVESLIVISFSSDGTASVLGFVVPYSVNGSTLIVNGEKSEIVKLTNSELILKSDEYDEYDEDDFQYQKFTRISK